jgi:hypothetical protein
MERRVVRAHSLTRSLQRFSVKRFVLSGFFPLSGSFWVEIDERGLTYKKNLFFLLKPDFRPKTVYSTLITTLHNHITTSADCPRSFFCFFLYTSLHHYNESKRSVISMMRYEKWH